MIAIVCKTGGAICIMTATVWFGESKARRLGQRVGELQGFQQSKPERLKDVMADLVSGFDVLILDAPAGISRDGVIPLTIADGVILVVTPEISSIVDSLKTKILTETVGGHVEGAIINRVAGNGDEFNRAQMERLLGVQVLGIIPEDANVRRASAGRSPIG